MGNDYGVPDGKPDIAEILQKRGEICIARQISSLLSPTGYNYFFAARFHSERTAIIRSF